VSADSQRDSMDWMAEACPRDAPNCYQQPQWTVLDDVPATTDQMVGVHPRDEALNGQVSMRND
jgi:hypothetical protein